jgi:predicted TIM-barrel fold metal-dependent hydrolase
VTRADAQQEAQQQEMSMPNGVDAVSREVVDADTHVLEHEGMWEHFDDDGPMYPYRPLLITLPTDTSWGGRNAFWLIDGEMYPKSAGRAPFPLHTPPTAVAELARTDISLGARCLTDLPARTADMDRREVGVQIVFPTVFLALGIQIPDLEVAICRAYNRFMAAACAESAGRLRFVATLPFQSRDAAIAEMHRAHEARAAGLFFRSFEAERSLGDAYFDPIYNEADRLHLPVCIHTGSARFTAAGLAAGGSNAAAAFTALVTRRVPERFPNLKFGFVEFGSMWLPEVAHRFIRHDKRTYVGPTETATKGGRFDPHLLRDYRIFIACFPDDNLPYVLQYSGEGNLMVGSDYGHQDPAQETQMVGDMRGRHDVDPAVVARMLADNARAFYALE